MSGVSRETPLAITHVFVNGEGALLRTVADALEWSYRWTAPAAQRLRFVLDFATGLRASELVGATLGAIEFDAHGAHWLHLLGKGAKAGKVVLPPRWRAPPWIGTWYSGAYQQLLGAGSRRSGSSAGSHPISSRASPLRGCGG